MKKNFLFIGMVVLSLTMMFTSCSKEEIITDSSKPVGTFTVSKSGTFVAENGAPSKGKVELGADENQVNFLALGSDFTTQLATGTVSVYLSTSNTFTADPGNGNPDLKQVGAINANGQQYIKLATAVDSKFTHVILWCNSAGVQFGNAALN